MAKESNTAKEKAILFITPAQEQEISGVKILSKRLFGYAQKNGFTVIQSPDLAVDIGCIHAFQAYRSATQIWQAKKKFDVPLITTVTGTDVNIFLHHRERENTALDILRISDTILVYAPYLKEAILRYDASLSGRIRVMNMSAHLDKTDFDLRKTLGIKAPIVFIPARLDQNKLFFFYEKAFRLLHQEFGVHLVFAGPKEKDLSKATTSFASENWVHHICIPHSDMRGAFESSDIVLNMSLTEGVSNALVEAMCIKKPIVASDIPGNRAIIVHRVNGMLYNSERTFLESIGPLLQDKGFARELGEKAYAYAKKEFNQKKESDYLASLYLETFKGKESSRI